MNDTTANVRAGRVAPIRREITVEASVDLAFALFTAHIGAWWPVAQLSVHGEGSLVAFEGDRLVERCGTQVAVWGEVVSWNPPRELRMAWHPGNGPDRATDLTVRFEADGNTTVVSVIQAGWERMADPTAAAAEYGHGWPEVLRCFSQRVGAVPTTTDVLARPDDSRADSGPAPYPAAQWFALLHRPGPALEPDESLFENPMFGEHVAFLQRLADRGWLVAAGPLANEIGAGMTVVKVPPEETEIDVADLATRDDQSVAHGYLTVEVRPWAVQLSA